MRMELREKDNIIEEMNEQIKKLQDQGSNLYCASLVNVKVTDSSKISVQDVLIEYAKTDGDASIVQDPDDPNNQLILKSTAKQVNKCLFSQSSMTVYQCTNYMCRVSQQLQIWTDAKKRPKLKCFLKLIQKRNLFEVP